MAPFAFRYAMESLKAGRIEVALSVVMYVAIRWLSTVLGDGKDLFFVPWEQKTILAMGEDVFDHLQRMPLTFHLNRQTGGMIRSLEKGLKGVENFFRYCIFTMIPTVIETFFMCIALGIFYPPFFSLTLFFTLMIYAIFTFLVSEGRVNVLRALSQLDRRARVKSLDNLLNYATVKYFHQEERERERYGSFLHQHMELNLKIRYSLVLLNVGQCLILYSGLGLLLWHAACGVSDHSMTLSDFVLMNVVILQFIMPLHSLGYAYREIKQSWLDITEMASIVSLPLETADEALAVPLQVSAGAISFRNVTFGYDAHRLILKQCSFEILGGSTVAFVGVTGAGKSTLFSLLSRFFNPQEGEIVLDGQSLSRVTRHSLREAIGIVPQDTILFNDSLWNNLIYGCPGIALEMGIHAARQARLHDFIMTLPHGYATQVGERGLKLSGGEKQRLSIARALLKNPRIFLFDEATASLDNATERAIQKDIFQLIQQKTAIFIAHRLSSIVDVDCIFVLHQGKVAEQGTHAKLMAYGGIYARLWAQQQVGSILSPSL